MGRGRRTGGHGRGSGPAPSFFHRFLQGPTAGRRARSCGRSFQFLDSLDGGESAHPFWYERPLTGFHPPRAGPLMTWPRAGEASCRGCWARPHSARTAPVCSSTQRAAQPRAGLSWAGAGSDEQAHGDGRPPAGVAPGAVVVGAGLGQHRAPSAVVPPPVSSGHQGDHVGGGVRAMASISACGGTFQVRRLRTWSAAFHGP